MGMPVKLSDNLVRSARAEAKSSDRSITAQIEHWATLGRAVEAALMHDDLLALKQHQGNLKQAFTNPMKRQGVLALLDQIAQATDRSSLKEKIRALGKPIYSIDPQYPGMLIKIDPDGRRTPGHLRNRRFVPARKKALAGS
jgi:ParD-like antitoxin of type II bacterial toxin-antitoxin system